MGGAPPPPLDFAPEGSEKTGFFGPEDRSPRGGVGVAEHHYGESVRARSRLGGSECAGVARGDTPETGPKPGPSQPGRPRGASPGTRVWIGGGGPEARQTRPTVTGQGPSRGAPRTPPPRSPPGRPHPECPVPSRGPPTLDRGDTPRTPRRWEPALPPDGRLPGVQVSTGLIVEGALRTRAGRDTRSRSAPTPMFRVQGGWVPPPTSVPIWDSVPRALPSPPTSVRGGTPRTPRRWASRW